MASPIFLPAGLAGSGIDSATAFPDIVSASVIYLNSGSAAASDANAGTEPELPLLTLAQAITNASAGSVISIASTHSQTISSAVNIAKAGLRLVGSGIGSARATFTPSSGATTVLNIQAGGVDTVIESIYFKAAAATSGAGGRVVSVASGTEVLSCQFDCGAFDQEAVLLNAGADNARIEASAFTAVGSRPTRAIGLAGTNTNVKLVNVTVDGSTFGWAGNSVTVTNCVHLSVKNLTLAGNSDVLGATTSSYQILGVTGSSTVRVTLS